MIEIPSTSFPGYHTAIRKYRVTANKIRTRNLSNLYKLSDISESPIFPRCLKVKNDTSSHIYTSRLHDRQPLQRRPCSLDTDIEIRVSALRHNYQLHRQLFGFMQLSGKVLISISFKTHMSQSGMFLVLSSLFKIQTAKYSAFHITTFGKIQNPPFVCFDEIKLQCTTGLGLSVQNMTVKLCSHNIV